MSERSFARLIAAQVELAIALEKTAALIRFICDADRFSESDAAFEDGTTANAQQPELPVNGMQQK